MNISGNYNTSEREVTVVKKILEKEKINFLDVKKYDVADDGDVLVTCENGKKLLIEVKEEEFNRFSKYGDLGIDFISAFKYKQGAQDWKTGPKSHRYLQAFLDDIDKNNNFKWGKLFYSKSDLWLFFVENEDKLKYYCFLDGGKVLSEDFKNYLYENCLFCVNNKPNWQLSNYDRHNSAVFYINHNDDYLKSLIINVKDFIEK